jgi:acetate kinase
MGALLASADPRAALAVDVFVCQIRRQLGSLAAALGGIDAIVFTAGIGENAPVIRNRVCRDAAWLGVELNEAANGAGGQCFSTASSRVSAYVIPTNQELTIARHTRRPGHILVHSIAFAPKEDLQGGLLRCSAK